jgi:hypothetical protein
MTLKIIAAIILFFVVGTFVSNRKRVVKHLAFNANPIKYVAISTGSALMSGLIGFLFPIISLIILTVIATPIMFERKPSIG